MTETNIYIFVLLVVFAVIAILNFTDYRNKRRSNLTPMAGLAFGLILTGFFFGEKRLVGYGLLGAGITLAIMDTF